LYDFVVYFGLKLYRQLGCILDRQRVCDLQLAYRIGPYARNVVERRVGDHANEGDSGCHVAFNVIDNTVNNSVRDA
jgi:hypothetical protein